MQRIMIFGGSGSGKSTLARQVGAITGLPVVHIDPMYWQPGWVQRPSAETEAMIRAACAAPTWVFEGNNSATIEERAAVADLIVYLDMPRHLRLWRFTRRWWTYRNSTRPDLPEGCNDKWDAAFVREFIWNYHRDRGPSVRARLAKWRAQGRPVVQLHSPRAVARFRAALEAAPDRPPLTLDDPA